METVCLKLIASLDLELVCRGKEDAKMVLMVLVVVALADVKNTRTNKAVR